MKNSIFFKFLAVIICAASLTGIVGGAAGALVLAEGDLYNKTVDQVIDQRLQDTAFVFADQTAMAYASRELGGCPADMAGQRYAVMPDCDYGYVILDAEGNALESRNPNLKEIAEVYTLPVTGQYTQWKILLAKAGLTPEADPAYTVLLWDGGDLIATGSRDGTGASPSNRSKGTIQAKSRKCQGL